MNDRPEMADERTQTGDEDRRSPPVFNLPRSLVITLALLIIIYLVQDYVLSEDMRAWFIVEFAFSPVRYIYPLGSQDFAWLWSPVTYSLLHGGPEHLIFNALWLMVFGAPVIRRIGTVRYLVFWVVSSVAAAFFHAGLNWGDATLLIGASGVISAFSGAACRFAFPPRGGYDRVHGHLYPRQTILGSFRNRTVVIFTVMWFAGNILVALGVTLVGGDVGPIAWDAHIGGFVFGFLLFGFFDAPPPRGLAITEP